MNNISALITHHLPKFLLLLVLLFMQYGSLVHAATHSFNDHGETNSCEVFFAAERLADSSLQSTFVVPIHINSFVPYNEQNQPSTKSSTVKPRPRAPPSIFS